MKQKRFLHFREWFHRRLGCSSKQPRVLWTLGLIREQRLPSLRITIGPVSEQSSKKK
jgi:hypothetical protein